MSFCEEARTEAAKVTQGQCCRNAQLCGALSPVLRETKDGFRATVYSQCVRDYLARTCMSRFGRAPETSGLNTLIFPAALCSDIKEAYGKPGSVPPKAVIRKECCKTAFLRGIFLGCGRLNSPESGYRLEFEIKSPELKDTVKNLLSDSGYEMKESVRRGSFILYMRKSEYIEDILNMLGISMTAFSLMNTKIEKQVRNDINRTSNCDVANAKKQARATVDQIEMIRNYEKKESLDSLPDDLREIAVLRRDNPALSLSEIGKLCAVPVSKSSIQRRFKKLEQYILTE